MSKVSDELRAAANLTLKYGSDDYNRIHNLADRIDAEHEQQLVEARAEGMQEGFAADKGPREFVELPKDADGEYVHVGDVLYGYGKTIEVVEMRHGRSGWVLISRDGNGYAGTFAFTHHKPTVEDVLREMLDAWGELPSNATNEAIIAEYADKLKLADA